MAEGSLEQATKLDLIKEQDANIEFAAARLAQEARQAAYIPQRSMKTITKAFEHASSFLESGQLIKDDWFTLFEAVGALEIMDPKMDTGAVMPGETIDIDQDPAEELSVAQLIWVLDELLCLEIAWLEDYPLSQTLFTSVHIDRILDPENRHPFLFELQPSSRHTLTNQVLHPYCLALVRCTSMVLDLARSQGFYEEEDFVSHTFGRDLLPDLSTEEALASLEDGLSWLSTSVKDSRLREALQARMTFRKLFIKSIFGQINGWQEMIALLDNDIESSRGVAEAKPECFTEKVLSHLAASTPPRPKLSISWKEAKAKWKKLCADVAQAPQLTSYWIRQSPACLQRAMWAFAARRPSTFPRSIIQDIMFVDGRIADDLTHLDLLLTDIRELVLPGDHLTDPDSFEIEAVSDVRHKCSRLMEAFLDGVIDEYLNIYRLVCQNRARIRRDLTQSISIFEILETQHAAKYDNEIGDIMPTEQFDTVLGKQQTFRPLSTWLRYYKLKVMADTILLGFETDIYLPDEMAHMYWFLSSLLNERRLLLEHIEVFTRHRATGLQDAGQNRQLAECIVSLQWFAALKAEIDVGFQLAEALNALFAILLHTGLIKAPARGFAHAQLLHEARMKIYLKVKDPAPPTSEDFAKARTLPATVISALDQINACVQVARTALTALKKVPADVAKYTGAEDRWKSEIKLLETTAVAIMVSATQLRRAHTKSKSDDWHQTLEVVIPTPEKRYHEFWVVPQVKEKR